jgi:DNA repair exonuclease SbcCD ATPase subunit
MRLPLVLLRVCAFVSLIVESASGQADSDPSDWFLNAYTAFQKGEKLESAGSFPAARESYLEAARELDTISARWPTWNPSIVKYRRRRTSEAWGRVESRLLPASPGAALPLIPPPETAPSAPPRDADDATNRLKQAQQELEELKKRIAELEAQCVKLEPERAQRRSAEQVLRGRSKTGSTEGSISDATDRLKRLKHAIEESKKQLAPSNARSAKHGKRITGWESTKALLDDIIEPLEQLERDVKELEIQQMLRELEKEEKSRTVTQ